MADRIGYYSPETAKMVLGVIEYLKRAGYITRRGQKSPRVPPSTIGHIFLTPSGGIPGRSGTKLNYADCTPYAIDSDDMLVELLDHEGNSQTNRVYHLGSSEVAGSVYIQAKWTFGRFLVDMEDCG